VGFESGNFISPGWRSHAQALQQVGSPLGKEKTSSAERSRDSSAEEGAEPSRTLWAVIVEDFSDVQEGLSRGFGLQGQLQALPPHLCSRESASSHCLTSSPAAPRHLEVMGCCFYLHRTPAAGGQWDETCLTHAHARTAASPLSCPGNLLLPPSPSLIKKLKLSISSHINMDLRPRQSPDTSHNLCWLQTAGGVCWRTRMTSHSLPQTGVTRSAWCGEGSWELGALSPLPTPLPPRRALDPPGWVMVRRTAPGTDSETRPGRRGRPRGREQGSWPGLRCRQRFMRADPLHRTPGAG